MLKWFCSLHLLLVFYSVFGSEWLQPSLASISPELQRLYDFFTSNNVGLSEVTAVACAQLLLTNFSTTSTVKLAMPIHKNMINLTDVCMDEIDNELVTLELRSKHKTVFMVNNNLHHKTIQREPQQQIIKTNVNLPPAEFDKDDIVASYFKTVASTPRFIENNFATEQDIAEIVKVSGTSFAMMVFMFQCHCCFFPPHS